MQISPIPSDSPRTTEIRNTAERLEAAFLGEMLKGAGLGAMGGAFGGGAGEEQFASFMREEQARLMVEAGGIGLAEQVVRSMTGGANG